MAKGAFFASFICLFRAVVIDVWGGVGMLRQRITAICISLNVMSFLKVEDFICRGQEAHGVFSGKLKTKCLIE